MISNEEKRPLLDTGCPDYRRGARAANTMLDIATGARAEELVGLAELSASVALQAEDTSRYLKAKGFIDTMREFLDDQGRCD